MSALPTTNPLDELLRRIGVAGRLKKLGTDAAAGAADVAEARAKKLAPAAAIGLFLVIAGAIAVGRRL